eukprot:TRINITY_DN7470_c0_g1_i1.p1 TRINITY_DN7470_c0_g1~~TRINITY_DN7470_c0_g1_i1.p1  ORF type:complete len:487 (-),score=133.52 TRINITY_DN7470_c0_g1_i1:143-1390(-)
MGDIHIHAREDETGKQVYKEDYTTVNASALNGGVGFVGAMPNTPNPLLTENQLKWHGEKTDNFPVSFFNYIGIGPGTLPLKGRELPYKCYCGPSVGQLFFRSEQQLRETLKNYTGKRVSFHVEDFDVLEQNKDKETHTERRPVQCVERALEYVLSIVEEYGILAKLCHWSTGGKSIKMIQEHRKKGFNTTIEISPLHLYFDSDFLKESPELWPYVQMNPALQSHADRLDLLEALRDGTIDFIATDHAPHTLDEKFVNFADVDKSKTPEENYKHLRDTDRATCVKLCCKNGVSGTPQLDTFALICGWLIKEHQFDPKRVAQVASLNPALFVQPFLNECSGGKTKDQSSQSSNQERWGKGFGLVEEGYLGSFTVIDMSQSTTVIRDQLKTKPKWSPFEGITFPCRKVATIIRGEVFH